jgi:hypothetical protein
MARGARVDARVKRKISLLDKMEKTKKEEDKRKETRTSFSRSRSRSRPPPPTILSRRRSSRLSSILVVLFSATFSLLSLLFILFFITRLCASSCSETRLKKTVTAYVFLKIFRVSTLKGFNTIKKKITFR